MSWKRREPLRCGKVGVPITAEEIVPFYNNFCGLLQSGRVATPGDGASFHFSLPLP